MCFKSVKYLDRSVTMCLLLWFCLLWSCSDKVPQKEEDKNILQVMSEDNIEDFDKYYKPAEFEGMDMLRSDAKWSWFRSKQSEHFFVFWEAGFGDDPNAETVPANLRVDIDDLLEKAELFYRTNVEKLKFAETGQGKSFLDRYKMEIYLLYQEEWLATGSGYDNIIGALWVNPSTCQPVGSTIAHESDIVSSIRCTAISYAREEMMTLNRVSAMDMKEAMVDVASGSSVRSGNHSRIIRRRCLPLITLTSG